MVLGYRDAHAHGYEYVYEDEALANKWLADASCDHITNSIRETLGVFVYAFVFVDLLKLGDHDLRDVLVEERAGQ